MYYTNIRVFQKEGISQQRSFGSGQEVKLEPVNSANEVLI